jgi:AcrR family transcriptional regulator
MIPPAVRDGRRVRGERTRQAIVGHASRLASSEGLEAVSLQRLADELGISKSGLFAAFGSKEDLQLATVAEAARVFTDEVLRPGLRAPRGVRRVNALCDSFISYLRRSVFPGGCFFEAAASEFDSRPGPVRDAVLANVRYWMESLARAVSDAQAMGEIAAEVDPKQLGWELGVLLSGTNKSFLTDGDSALKRGRRAIRDRLVAVSAPS